MARNQYNFYGRAGGVVPEPLEIVEEVKKILGGKIMAIVFERTKGLTPGVMHYCLAVTWDCP